MAQEYDKILKENIEALIIPLADKLLGLTLGELEELPDNLQATLERKPDFLKRVVGTSDHPSYLLHLEFQVRDETTMIDRMLPRFLWFKQGQRYSFFHIFGYLGCKQKLGV